MCTLIALHRLGQEAPLVVAANRDEYLERPAEPPTLRRFGARTAVAPRDRRAGGTWLGLNDAGVFAAITNRPSPQRDDSRRSRGLLVADALACDRAHQAARRLERLPARAYNPFNFFVADAHDAFAVVYDDKPATSELAPGIHVIGNTDPDDRAVPKLAALFERVESVVERAPDALLAGLAAICRSHDGPGGLLDAPCVHADGYGTRSSTLLRVAASPEASALRHAEGPPCRTAYRNLTPLLEGLAGTRSGGNARRER